MTSEVFVDTGAWYALQVPDDRWHASAAETLPVTLSRGIRLVTTNCVAGETYTLLRRTHGHRAAWRFRETLLQSPRLKWVHVDERTEREAYELLKRFDDQAFSFVDGTSFAVMRRLRTRVAFAYDVHFATAGFTRIPLDTPP